MAHPGCALHLPHECHTLHTTEQSPNPCSVPGGLQGHPPPHEAAQQHHRHIITLNRKITGGSRGSCHPI